MRITSMLAWPFVLLWGLVRLLVWPVLVVVAAYFLLPDSWFALVTVVVGIYVLIVFWVWRMAARGWMRSMARGAVTVRKQRVRGGR